MQEITEIILFKEEEAKLAKLLAAYKLLHTFNANEYPISLSVSQNCDPAEQMELYSTDDGASSRDSRLTFQFRDGEILVRTDSRLIIPDDLFTKVKGKAKKLHYLYLQAYFRATRPKSDAGDDEENPGNLLEEITG